MITDVITNSRPSENISSITPTILKNSTQNGIHSLAITSKTKFVPAQELFNVQRMFNDDDQMLGVSRGRTTEVNDLEKYLPPTDTGDNLHPVFSRIFQSEHSTILKNYLNIEKNILPTDLGYTPAKVITTNVRWHNATSNESKDDKTYHTEIKRLSNLCTSHNVNPLDVLGLALATNNKMVKNERKFRKEPKAFDYAEAIQKLVATFIQRAL